MLREEDILRVFENRVLRRNLGLRWTRQEGRGGSSTVRSFVLLTRYHPGDQVKTNWVAGMRTGKSTCRVLIGNFREKAHLEDLGVDGS